MSPSYCLLGPLSFLEGNLDGMNQIQGPGLASQGWVGRVVGHCEHTIGHFKKLEGRLSQGCK